MKPFLIFSKVTRAQGITFKTMSDENNASKPCSSRNVGKMQTNKGEMVKGKSLQSSKGKEAGNSQDSKTDKRKHGNVSLLLRQKMITDHHNGLKQAEIAQKYGLPKSTVGDTLRNKGKYIAIVSDAPSSHLDTTHKSLCDYFLQLQLKVGNWVLIQASKGKPVSQVSICSKAKEIQQNMVEALEKDKPDQVEQLKQKHQKFFRFKASRGWFQRFKKRADLKHVKIHGESASADHDGAIACQQEFKDEVEERGLDERQVFNVDETGLMWKRSPNATFLPTSFAPPEGFKVDKKRITLLLGGNAAGYKLKPLVINQFKQPRSFANRNPEELGVNWAHNKKAWMTGKLFKTWFEECFLPEVEGYLEEEGLSNNILLVVDNATGHPQDLVEDHDNVTLYFLPPNTTSLIQPMDQGVIRSFKVCKCK